MVERDIILKLKADTTGLEKGLGDVSAELLTINQQLTGIEDELRNLSKETSKGEAAKAFDKLNGIIEKNVLSIQELGVAADNFKNIALAAGTTSPIGQEALKRAAEMEREMDKLNQSVANLAEGGRSLNAAMQIGTGVVAGYTAFQGVTALLGQENEDLQKTFIKLQAAQSVLMGAKELSIALDKKGLVMTTAQATAQKILTAVQAAYAAVVGASIGALKFFRIALASTGIGLLIVGLVLLVTNFDRVIEVIGRVVESFKGLGKAINAEEIAMQKIRDMNASETQKIHRKRMSQIEEELKAVTNAIDETIDAYKLEKDTLEANGKASDELTIKILEAEKEKLKAIVEANQKKIQSYIDYYTTQAALRGEDEAAFKKSMLNQGIDLDMLQAKADGLIQKNQDNVQYAENAITKFKREQNEQRGGDFKTTQDEIIKEQEKAANEQLKIEAELTALLLANMEDGAEKELAILMDKQGRERDALIAAHGENSELLEQLDIKQEKELEALQDKFNKERLKKEDEYYQQLTDLRIGNMEDGKDKELAALRLSQAKELDELRLKYGAETELEKELLIKQKEELAAVEKEFDDQATEKKLADAQETLDTINSYFEQAQQINELLNELGDRKKERIDKESDERLKALEKTSQQVLSREGLTDASRVKLQERFAMQEFQIKKAAAEAKDKIDKRTFQREKGFKLAQIAMDTAAGIMKAVAASPLTGGLPFSAVVGGIGISQAAMVASQRFEGSASSIEPPNFSSVSSGGSGGSSSSGGSGSSSSSGGSGSGSQNNTGTSVEDLLNQPKQKVELSMVEVLDMAAQMVEIESVSKL